MVVEPVLQGRGWELGRLRLVLGGRVRPEPLFVGCFLCSVGWWGVRPSVLSAPFILVHRLGQGGQPSIDQSQGFLWWPIIRSNLNILLRSGHDAPKQKQSFSTNTIFVIN